jgi:MFS transporter, ACDE family, multidrug resistance protein
VNGAGAPPRWVALVTLFLARAVYAFNWYNIGAVLPLVGKGLAIGPAELGIVLAAFLVGAGIFQLPAGFAARRWGNRPVSVGALAAMAAFTLASAASPNWIVLAATRFGAGAGAAFFFAPALGLATAYFPAGSRGPVIGLYNSGFSLGAGVGLSVGATIGVLFGWSWALASGGLLLAGGTVMAALLLPRVAHEEAPSDVRELWRESLPVLRSRAIWALALGTSGLWAAFYVAAQYFVEFASQVHESWSLLLAAAVPTVMIVAEIPGGPIGGWFAERRGRLRRTLVLWGIAAGVGVALVPIFSLAVSWAAFLFLGFADGVVFALLYLLPTHFVEVKPSQYALGLGLLNSIQIFIGSAVSFAFGVIAVRAGYTAAWVMAGAFAIAVLPFLAWVPASERPRFGQSPLAD